MLENTTEITPIIKDEVLKFVNSTKASELGRVVQVGDGIARAHGLNSVMSGELVEFEDNVGAVLFGEHTKIAEGDTVSRTRRIMSVPVGAAMVGRVVNALGEPIDERGPIETDEYAAIERIAPGVVDRQPVKEPLQTGLKAIDSMIPSDAASAN